jgi:predicted TPR repeat methyltransferase
MDSKEAGSDSSHNDFAADYDQQVCAYGWWGHEALFGLCYEFVHPHENLLDVGIGTGLASALFARAGLQVYGFDSSLEMLNRCRAKNITTELRHFDLATTPWPYPEAFFDHAIACGVLHFFADLRPFFSEAARVIRSGGILAFTTRAPPPGSTGVTQETIDGIDVFSHTKAIVEDVNADYGFEPLKCLRLSVGSGEERPDSFFAFVTRKSDT